MSKLQRRHKAAVPALPDAAAPPAEREQLLALAGITPQVFAEAIALGFKRCVEALDAKAVQRLVVAGGRGEPATVETFEDIDHNTRLRAQRQLNEMAGVMAPAKGGSGGPSMVVNVIEREQAPPRVEVIEVRPS